MTRNRNPLTKLTLLFAVLVTLGAARVQADILPGVSISFAPVGLTMDQTARLNLVNTGVPNGMLINKDILSLIICILAVYTASALFATGVYFILRRQWKNKTQPAGAADRQAQADTSHGRQETPCLKSDPRRPHGRRVAAIDSEGRTEMQDRMDREDHLDRGHLRPTDQ
jgi:hypothetical protein